LAGNLSDVRSAVSAGVEIVQYREKSGESGALYEEALRLAEICRGTEAKFIVNDRIDIALAVDADGVHLGQNDIPYDVARRILGADKIIGITVHSVEEAVKAERGGADYLGVSPIFSTSTKKDAGIPAGLKLIADVKRVCKIPVVAIGGIDLSNAPEIIAAGADMVCAISAVITKPDVVGEMQKFQALF
jgi:thiamine-phosphate pyrophosphorylase